MTFLDTLRSLDKAATPGPWIAEDAKGDTVFIPALTTRYSSVMPRVGMDDGALIVALRNSAPALAAVIEAAESLAAAIDQTEVYGTHDIPLSHINRREAAQFALRAALVALDGGAK